MRIFIVLRKLSTEYSYIAKFCIPRAICLLAYLGLPLLDREDDETGEQEPNADDENESNGLAQAKINVHLMAVIDKIMARSLNA